MAVDPEFYVYRSGGSRPRRRADGGADAGGRKTDGQTGGSRQSERRHRAWCTSPGTLAPEVRMTVVLNKLPQISNSNVCPLWLDLTFVGDGLLRRKIRKRKYAPIGNAHKCSTRIDEKFIA